ncbi:MAG: hypothetical protein M1829_000614 [Trizodia sp. TS-e1964]|nr:MAG: hypothetical protein M1829_000614 [Trizodia sp. TS-e1964]
MPNKLQAASPPHVNDSDRGATSSKSLLDDIINSINDLLFRAVSAVEAGFASTPPADLGFHAAAEASGTVPDTDDDGQPVYPAAAAERENGAHQLETLLEAAVDRNFDKFEIYTLRNILTVPDDTAPWMRLAHYERLDFRSASDHHDAPTVESVLLQRRKLAESCKVHAALVAEHRRNEVLLKQLRALLDGAATAAAATTTAATATTTNPTTTETAHPLAFLTQSEAARALGVGAGAGSPARPLATTTAFALAQLAAMRETLGVLLPKLEAVGRRGTGRETEEERGHGAEQVQRTKYVEERVRRHLEGAGVELEGQGRLRDAEWVGGGVGGEGVSSLEALVRAMEGAEGGGERGEEGV